MKNLKNLIVITGPTACGKTSVAIELAKMINGEIVSADSMQVYRGMDIGTAKPALEERQNIPHHLLDVADPVDHFSAAIFQSLAWQAIDDIFSRGNTPILVGGTGFYIDVALHQDALQPNREMIPKYDAKKFILTRDRAKLYEAINNRVDIMVKIGLVDEVKKLLSLGIQEGTTAMQALGYKEIIPYLNGECTLDDAVAAIKQGSRRYAKRQLTWFRNQIVGEWLDMDDITPQEAARRIYDKSR